MRILHLISSEGVSGGMQSALFMPLLTRMPKQRVKAQIVTLGAGVIPSAVLRQQGVPVHDLAFSRRKFSMRAFSELVNIAREFRPDILHAWGQTAQLAALAVRARCDKSIRVVWSAANTAPLPRKPGLIDRQKLKLAVRFSSKADRIVFTSESGASQHERAGYSEHARMVIPPGVDATRFKADPSARAKVRDQLELPADAFVIGMLAPFQPEYDHATLLKAMGEVIKTHPNAHLVLAGHGVHRGNAPLMAMLGGALGTHVHLLGEWSDVASLFNACDLVCSSAVTDTSRMTLAMAMLCDVPCVSTGMGAQGEVIGQFGIAVEPGSPAAFVRAIGRILQMPQDRLTYMVNGARKHALKNFVQISSLQKYLQLYHDVIGRESLVTNEAEEAVSSVKSAAESVQDMQPGAEPAPRVEPTIAAEQQKRVSAATRATMSDPPARPASRPMPVAPRKEFPAAKPKPQVKDKLVSMTELADPDSLETTVSDEPVRAKPLGDVDVLVSFESSIAKNPVTVRKDSERARGVADETEDLLAPEALQASMDAGASTKSAPSSQPRPSAGTLSASLEPLPQADSAGLQLQLIPDEPLIEPKQVAGR